MAVGLSRPGAEPPQTCPRERRNDQSRQALHRQLPYRDFSFQDHAPTSGDGATRCDKTAGLLDEAIDDWSTLRGLSVRTCSRVARADAARRGNHAGASLRRSRRVLSAVKLTPTADRQIAGSRCKVDTEFECWVVACRNESEPQASFWGLASGGGQVSLMGSNVRSLRLLEMTRVEDRAIAAAAMRGLSRPAAAIGMAAML
jgi:hypothetical protein